MVYLVDYEIFPTVAESFGIHTGCHYYTQSKLKVLGWESKQLVKSKPIHLQPLVEATWLQSMVQRGVEEDKTLDQVIELIEAESEARNPLHQRRMELLRVNKSGSHFPLCIPNWTTRTLNWFSISDTGKFGFLPISGAMWSRYEVERAEGSV